MELQENRGEYQHIVKLRKGREETRGAIFTDDDLGRGEIRLLAEEEYGGVAMKVVETRYWNDEEERYV